MAAKMQDVVDLARIPLNDDDPVDGNRRYPNAKLLTYAIHGLLQSFRSRPDLYIGNYDNKPKLTMALTSNFPLDDEYVQVIADYVTARIESGDDEYVSNGRAAAFMSLFGGALNG